MAQRFLFLLLTFVLTNCKPHKQAQQTATGIFGTWNYVESSGGFTGKGTGWNTPVTIHLNRDFSFERKEGNKVVESDRFKLLTMPLGEDSVKILDMENGLDKRYRISADSLFLDEVVNDGYSYLFLRKK